MTIAKELTTITFDILVNYLIEVLILSFKIMPAVSYLKEISILIIYCINLLNVHVNNCSVGP